MEDLKESSDVLLIMFSGNLFQSVIVLGKKSSFVVKSFTNCRTTNFFVGLAEICILSVLCLTENLRSVFDVKR